MKPEEKRKKIVPGFRAGHLTVDRDTGERKNGHIVWNCICDCGNEIKVDRRTLLRGTVTDCGCLTKVRPGQRDITGQKFGRLTARYCTDRRDASGSYYWHCTCDCGGEVDASLGHLTTGYQKSCGCLLHPPLKDMVGKRFGKLTVTAYAGKENGMHRWKCVCDCGKETIVGQSLLLDGRTKSCGCIRANIYRENLKLVDGTSVTMLERNLSPNRPYRNNTSGHVGVYYLKKSGRWSSQIIFKGKKYYLGVFENKLDAVRARERAEEIYSDFLDWYYREYLSLSEEEKTGAFKRGLYP
ncbi:MAG: transcriptional regulator [Clostridiales bacterium]|nr:transcriptional regulator [Clostridiales bacterium]